MAFSVYLGNKILDHVLKVAAFSQPSGLYVALSTVANPTTATDAAYTGAEAVGGSYARVTLTEAAAANKQSANSNTLTWTNLAALTLTGVMILDALTAGNLLLYGPLSAPATIAAGGGYQLPNGTLTQLLQ